MSSTEGDQPDRAAFHELEVVVGRALDRIASLRERAEVAEARAGESEELVRRFTGDPDRAGQLLTRLSDLEEENADLRDRLEKGRGGVDRLLARIRFLENQR